MAANSLIKSHPGKFLWTLSAVLSNAVKLPFWAIYLLSSSTRQNPKWSFKQALRIQILKAFVKNMAEVEMKTPENFKPGKEGDQFIVIQPGNKECYVGIVQTDDEIKPKEIGGTWYPRRPDLDGKLDLDVILHFHGGAFAIGDGRTKDCGFLAKTLLENTSATHVFCPQYRLASNPLSRFPAQLQDAITSLLYLTDMLRIPVEKITISGDSAGGNLCLSLLRYVKENPLTIPSPMCAFLWSPWVDPGGSLVEGRFKTAPNKKFDYLSDGFGAWGARSFAPAPSTKITLSHPNICFIGTAFETETRLWFSVGQVETLFHDIHKVFEGFEGKNGEERTRLWIEDGTVHDILLVGGFLGFEKEAGLAAKSAGRFLAKCREDKKLGLVDD